MLGNKKEADMEQAIKKPEGLTSGLLYIICKKSIVLDGYRE